MCVNWRSRVSDIVSYFQDDRHDIISWKSLRLCHFNSDYPKTWPDFFYMMSYVRDVIAHRNVLPSGECTQYLPSAYAAASTRSFVLLFYRCVECDCYDCLFDRCVQRMSSVSTRWSPVTRDWLVHVTLGMSDRLRLSLSHTSAISIIIITSNRAVHSTDIDLMWHLLMWCCSLMCAWKWTENFQFNLTRGTELNLMETGESWRKKESKVRVDDSDKNVAVAMSEARVRQKNWSKIVHRNGNS